MKKILRVLTLLMAFLLTGGCGKEEKKESVRIGTGSSEGIYFFAGNKIASLFNKEKSDHQTLLSVEATTGSVFNINSVSTGYMELGLTQADREYQAFYGKGIWEGNPLSNLRFICSLHTEIVTLVTTEDQEIEGLKDLKNKTVSLGSYGSGTRGNALDILYSNQLLEDRDYKADALSPDEASSYLQEGRINAFFYTIGHPSDLIKKATEGKKKVKFIEITGAESLMKGHPYYKKAEIDRSFYPNALNASDIRSIGMQTNLITSEEVPEETVYNLTKAIFENLDTLKASHPAFEKLDKKEMFQGGFAPMHPGAKRYFTEIGLM